jgi:proteasome lid subunit RPN8/RPN11
LEACVQSGVQEACGVLLGTLDPPRVLRAVSVENAAADPGRGYAIPGARVLALEREAARPGLQVVGFYHSHPAGPATPSAADLAEAWPGYVYLIVGRRDGGHEARAWRLAADRHCFEEALMQTGTVA